LFAEADGTFKPGAIELMKVIKQNLISEKTKHNDIDQAADSPLIIGHDFKRKAKYETIGNRILAMSTSSAMKPYMSQFMLTNAVMQMRNYLFEKYNKWTSGNKSVLDGGVYRIIDGKGVYQKEEIEGYLTTVKTLIGEVIKAKGNLGKVSTTNVQRKNLVGIGFDITAMGILLFLAKSLVGKDDEDEIKEAREYAKKHKQQVNLNGGFVNEKGVYQKYEVHPINQYYSTIFAGASKELLVDINFLEVLNNADNDVVALTTVENMANTFVSFASVGDLMNEPADYAGRVGWNVSKHIPGAALWRDHKRFFDYYMYDQQK